MRIALATLVFGLAGVAHAQVYGGPEDLDLDGVVVDFDNCPWVHNSGQADGDADGVGDECDNCVSASNSNQEDIDFDGFGDACDVDADGDMIQDSIDNCPMVPNAPQVNYDADSEGDACDDDDDNDGIDDILDDCRLGVLGVDPCDDDADGDSIPGSVDNCPGIFNPQLDRGGNQIDTDADGLGDVCDTDLDGDGVANAADNCMLIANPNQIDADFDGVGDNGDWSGGAGSCDAVECYVVAGDLANCLDPSAAFSILFVPVGNAAVGETIDLLLFSNRPGVLHNWTASFDVVPTSSSATLVNATGSETIATGTTQVTACLAMSGPDCIEWNNVRFVPDLGGTYGVGVSVGAGGDIAGAQAGISVSGPGPDDGGPGDGAPPDDGAPGDPVPGDAFVPGDDSPGDGFVPGDELFPGDGTTTTGDVTQGQPTGNIETGGGCSCGAVAWPLGLLVLLPLMRRRRSA